MKYLFFEKSAIEELISKTSFQSIEFPQGNQFVQTICGESKIEKLGDIRVKFESDKGIFFVGQSCSKIFLLFDLTQCNLMIEKAFPDSLLLVFQKVFRTALRFWNHQPFTSSERIHGSKSIVFPFVFTDHRRIVLERAVKCDRLTKRGIDRPLLVYKYGVDDAPRGEEVAETLVLREAGETYLSYLAEFSKSFLAPDANEIPKTIETSPLVYASAMDKVGDGGFVYLTYEQQLSNLTVTQKDVVQNPNLKSPIRIDGPAGTGKTASMILRAYYLLKKARDDARPFRVVFFAHSESTKCEIETAFSFLENSSDFLLQTAQQHIEFTTLFEYCINTIKVNVAQVIEQDAVDAKQTQRILIEEALDQVYKEKYKTFKPLLSKEICKAFNSEITPKGVLVSMLQHEFSVQIKGRTDATIDEYYLVEPINNALPIKEKKDKEFVFLIFLKYQNMLRDSSVYDIDDITIQALAQWNAPIWRRERATQGYDYIFVDEMHLFNINEQNAFHYLTKSADQKQIPLCFALDYSQAIGDRGNINQDYIETTFGAAEQAKYKTVFRCSQQITDFCAAVSASGALMFQNDYRNPYDTATSGFTGREDALCEAPALFMYGDEDSMISSLKAHIDKCKQELQCKNYEIAIISFENTLLYPEKVVQIEAATGKKVSVLQDRCTSCLDKSTRANDPIIMSDPYNINGLEFKCVILFGVDEGRVPQTTGISDISANYIKYIAFNQLYLAASRAKYRLILIGNKLHGVSSSLQYAIESGVLQPNKC